MSPFEKFLVFWLIGWAIEMVVAGFQLRCKGESLPPPDALAFGIIVLILWPIYLPIDIGGGIRSFAKWMTGK